MDPRVSYDGTAQEVPIQDLRPNEFNYNTQNEKTFSKLVESMRRFGFTLPVIVRQREGDDGEPFLEIVDGEHRWRAALMLKMRDIPVINLGQVEDEKAKQLCIILNELGGKPDEVRLAELLRDINQTVSVDDLLGVMPYSTNELDMYIKAMDFSFDHLPSQSSKSEEEEKADMLRLKLGWEGDEAEVMLARLAMISEDPKKAVELCVKKYLDEEEDDDVESDD